MARVDLPRGEGGERRQRTRSFKTRREAEEWVARTVAEVANGYTTTDTTTERYLAKWLEAVRGTVRARTAENYAANVGRLVGRIGKTPLGKLTPLEIQHALSELPREWAPATRRDVYKVLHVALRQAVGWGLIPRDPSAGVKPPPLTQRELVVWTEEEAARFLAAAERNHHHALFRLALATGMRQGELLGLRWQDVNFEARALYVRHSLTWPSKQAPRLEEPKTRGSRRKIPLDSATVDVLRTHRKRQLAARLAAGAAWEDHDLVFPNPTGGFMRKKSLGQNMRPICREAGVPVIRFHDLRHTHATLLLRAGVSPKVVAERLGHTSIKMTLDTYSHVLPDMQEAAVRALEEVFRGRA
jgi:integrase